jgi:WD40 repeat protein
VESIFSIAWHPSGRWIAVSDLGGAIHRMDAQTGEKHVLGQHRAQAVMTLFSPDGDYLFSGGWERELICWDVAGMRRAFTIGLDSYVIRFRADGRQCAVMTPSGVQLHAFERPILHREFAEDLGPRLRHAAFSPDGRWLAASADKRLSVWDLADGGPGALAEEGSDAHCFFTIDGRELFGSSGNNSTKDCYRWRITPAEKAGAPPGLERLPFRKPKGFSSLSLWSNSVVVTTTSSSQLLAPEAIDAGSNGWVRTAQGINGVSPDGRWLAIYRPYSTNLFVYQLPELESIARLPHPANIGDFQFSPLGNEVAVASRLGVELWSTATWDRTRVLTNFSRILYAPDARTVWLTKDLRTAGLYDARTLEPLLMLPTGMLPLALSPDGRRIAVSVDMRRLQVWDVNEFRVELAKLGLDW